VARNKDTNELLLDIVDTNVANVSNDPLQELGLAIPGNIGRAISVPTYTHKMVDKYHK